ncbi:MAG TPA: protein translocase subunit SecD [Candidatus Acetothermia bacterium]|nr:protein translocase subunit SecD [Candidatus Acetothermia bacterium]
MAHSNMARNDWLRFGTVLLVIVGSLALLYPFWPLKDVIPLGLDLQGGVRLVLQAQDVSGMTAAQKQDTLDRVITILNNRVDQYGMANAEIKRMGTDRILVNLPGTKNPAQARSLIGQTAMLGFHKVIEAGTSPNSDLVPSSSAQEVLYNRDHIPYVVETKPLLTGAALSDARVRTSQSMQNAGALYIALTFNQKGAQKFVEALRQLKGDNPNTPQNEGDLLAVVLDNVIYSAPRITQSIKDAAAKGWRSVQNTTTISGKFTKAEAMRIAIVLRAGALPVAVKVVEENTVGPTLGRDSIHRGMLTIVIGFILIMLYMPLYYRMLGIVADAALVLNMLILFSSLVIFHATLTLPGIAGIILTIGMTVDANVIIFERIKEERRTGKSPLASVRTGFEKSLSALFDANITTLLTALILLLVGTGPVKGFAITLGIGVTGSLYCALIASRLLLEKAGFAEHIPVRVVTEQ